MSTTIVDLDAPRLATREAGSGEPAVVFLHGLGGSRIAWEEQLSGLGGGRRLIAWDQPGYGASRPLDGPMTFTGLADAVAELLDERALDSVHLVGLSFGGMIAQYVALAHADRVRSLALLSTSPAFGLDGTSPQEWLSARMAGLETAGSPARAADAVLRGVAGPHIDDAAFARQRAAMARIPADGLRAAISCLITHDTRARLHEITAPTLVLSGALDAETPPTYGRALAEAIPGASFHLIAGAGHLLGAEAPEEVNRLLIDHFDHVESSE